MTLCSTLTAAVLSDDSRFCSSLHSLHCGLLQEKATQVLHPFPSLAYTDTSSQCFEPRILFLHGRGDSYHPPRMSEAVEQLAGNPILFNAAAGNTTTSNEHRRMLMNVELHHHEAV
ncbi:hypothetical protein CYLTODRAFT_419836, partial [Cylindrobasidium torrendii FP15055 ss-10]